jgi:hypothetical protein
MGIKDIKRKNKKVLTPAILSLRLTGPVRSLILAR